MNDNDLPRPTGLSFRATLLLYVVSAMLVMVLLEAGSDALISLFRATLQQDAIDLLTGNTLPSVAFGRLAASNTSWDLIDVPLWFVIALLLAWVLTRSALQPLQKLSNIMLRRSQNHYPDPVAVPPGDDELSRLTLGFNQLICSLQGFADREQVFTYYASYRLRPPMSELRLQLEKLEASVAPAAEVLPVLEQSVERVDEILATLLALARAPEAEPYPMAPPQLIGQVLGSLSKETQARVHLKLLNYPGTRVRVTGALLVQQALRSLIDNALERSPHPAMVTVETNAEHIIIRVIDAGTELSDTLIDKLMHPSFHLSTYTDSLYPGLALVQHIARSLGGELELANTDTGLEAILSLPTYSYKRSAGRDSSATPTI